ncbi:hypothetical protein [Pseudarthrobacter sp. YAF2]|uniref:hypothetical protein n=1 Tax=Pseudarthrobacter sp. YAF2 TaxID=3233078 RepID=UPI003F953A67
MADPSGKGSQPLVADGCGTQGLSQVGVQGCHPVGGEEADMQEKGIQGLGDVIIGSSLHAGEDRPGSCADQRGGRVFPTNRAMWITNTENSVQGDDRSCDG